jgi:hypothetical protein
MVRAGLADDVERFRIADGDGGEREDPLVQLEKVRAGMTGFVA